MLSNNVKLVFVLSKIEVTNINEDPEIKSFTELTNLLLINMLPLSKVKLLNLMLSFWKFFGFFVHPQMLQIVGDSTVGDSLHANEVVSQVRPHPLKVCVLSSRHLFASVSCWNILSRSIDFSVDLHIECEQSSLSLIINLSIDVFEFLV